MLIRIAILEDHMSFFEGFKHSLSDYSNIVIAQFFNCLEHFYANFLPTKNSFDVLLLDLNIQGTLSFETLDFVKEIDPHFPCVFLTGEQCVFNETIAYRKLANGFIFKYETTANIVETIQRIYNGEKVFTTIHNKKFMEKHEHLLNTMEHLTPKEKILVKKLATDLSIEEIATSLHLSIRSIHGYRDRLYKKFDVNNRTAFLLKCQKYNIHLL